MVKSLSIMVGSRQILTNLRHVGLLSNSSLESIDSFLDDAFWLMAKRN